jgi:hypothetical protein
VNAIELEQRQRVVTIARSWIGTTYQHGSRIKGVAADCTYFAKVYEEAGLVPEVPIECYSSNAHLHRASGQYLQHIRRYAREIAVEQVRPGDIAMFHIARDFSHGGVINAHDWPEHVSDFATAEGWPWIIHANMTAGLVFEERGDQTTLALSKAVKFFTLWGL